MFYNIKTKVFAFVAKFFLLFSFKIDFYFILKFSKEICMLCNIFWGLSLKIFCKTVIFSLFCRANQKL